MANYARVANFGDPLEQDWQKNNLVTVVAPNGQRFVVHKDAAPSFQGLLNDLGNTGYDIKSDGGFNYRNIRGSDKLSQHAFGNAIDVNASENPLGSRTHNLPSNVSQMAEKRGLEWGGDWKSRPDPMHFEWTGKAETTVGSPAADGFEMPSTDPVRMQPTMLAKANPALTNPTASDAPAKAASDTVKIAGYDVSKTGIASLLDGLDQGTKAVTQQHPMSAPVLAANDVSPMVLDLMRNNYRRRISGLL